MLIGEALRVYFCSVCGKSVLMCVDLLLWSRCMPTTTSFEFLSPVRNSTLSAVALRCFWLFHLTTCCIASASAEVTLAAESFAINIIK